MLGQMMNDITLHSSSYLDSKLMKKLLLTFLILGSILPSVEAGVSPEGIPRSPRNFFPEGRHRPRKRCKVDGQIVVCKMPRPRKCTLRRPCVPRGYYRPNPPRVIPMPLR